MVAFTGVDDEADESSCANRSNATKLSPVTSKSGVQYAFKVLDMESLIPTAKAVALPAFVPILSVPLLTD